MRGDGEGWLRRGFYSPGIDLSVLPPPGHYRCLLAEWAVPCSITFLLGYETVCVGCPAARSICEHGNELFPLSPLPPCPKQLLELAKPLALPILWPKSRASTGRWMAKQNPLVCRFPVGYQQRRRVFLISIWWRENHSCACHALLVGFVMQRKQSQKTAHSQSKLIGMKSLCSAIRKGERARGSGYGNFATLFIS